MTLNSKPPRGGRAEINVWDDEGTLVATYLVEDFESLLHEVNRERTGHLDGSTSVHSSVIESIVFRFEFPSGMTTARFHSEETP